MGLWFVWGCYIPAYIYIYIPCRDPKCRLVCKISSLIKLFWRQDHTGFLEIRMLLVLKGQKYTTIVCHWLKSRPASENSSIWTSILQAK